MEKRAKELEAANLRRMDVWAMRGEVTADKRPANSALEIEMDFEHARRPPPVITEEVTRSIEDIIKQRIIEHRYDDVQRKAKPVATTPKDVAEVDDSKPQKGLGEVYEEEFMKATGAHGLTKETERDKLKKESSAIFKDLCLKLDAMSHFHFTPKQVTEDMTVRPAVPALAMEEVAPIAVTDADMLAPEELYEAGGGAGGVRGSAAGEVIVEGELTREDRKRLRAKRKRKQKAELKQEEHKKRSKYGIYASLVGGNKLGESKNTKKGEAAKDTSYTKSAKVFAHLEDSKSRGAAGRHEDDGKGRLAARAGKTDGSKVAVGGSSLKL
ncbi:hypothetical protein CBR_g26354 [Chara braunii]|uniref:Uncharacterized protein n=1 Tax=Chara braunii TaxID=69332 RepID=A0A388L7P8_CHABU|nr:hypothetical protein CBR_g26354 [Chara braunii]|eukprot:GBG78326.1 hypothetical protein CBR_g26354 [Chara braunii]